MTKDEKAMQALRMLNEKRITLKDCLMIFGQLRLEMPKDPVEAIKNMYLKQNYDVRKPTIKNLIEAKTYLETDAYIKELIKTGVNVEDLKDELLKQWDEGKITGFSYRYVIEALGSELPIEFIKHAEMIGRFTY